MNQSVFISSTFIDLARHRELILDAVRNLEVGSRAMEHFGALPGTPKEECLRLVRSASIYVGVFAMRYGSIDPESGKSLTHLEYLEAQTVRLPTLAYLIDERSHPVLPVDVDTGPKATSLQELKDEIRRNHVVSFFSSPEHLATKVTQDLVKLVRAIERKPVPEVLSNLVKHSVHRYPLGKKRFEFLKSKLANTFPKGISDSVLQEAFEVAIAGDKMAATYILSHGGHVDARQSIDGLMELESVLAQMVEQHQNDKPADKDA